MVKLGSVSDELRSRVPDCAVEKASKAALQAVLEIGRAHV